MMIVTVYKRTRLETLTKNAKFLAHLNEKLYNALTDKSHLDDFDDQIEVFELSREANKELAIEMQKLETRKLVLNKINPINLFTK